MSKTWGAHAIAWSETGALYRRHGRSFDEHLHHAPHIGWLEMFNDQRGEFCGFVADFAAWVDMVELATWLTDRADEIGLPAFDGTVSYGGLTAAEARRAVDQVDRATLPAEEDLDPMDVDWMRALVEALRSGRDHGTDVVPIFGH